MRRFYYYFIPIILLLIVLLGLYYPQLNITIQQALTTANTIKIFLYSHHKLITNASISVFAFYPTSNGTTFQKIYNASNKQYYQFPVKKLDKWAEQWIKFNKKEKTTIYPSILILATYSIINQTTIITLTQTYATPLNITQIINGQGGKNIIIKFKTPIKHKIKLKNNNNNTNNNNIQNKRRLRNNRIHTKHHRMVPKQQISRTNSNSNNNRTTKQPKLLSSYIGGTTF